MNRLHPNGALTDSAEPQPPDYRLFLRVLGPLEVRKDGRPVPSPGLRRNRVRSLLLLITARRKVARHVAAAELWPGFSEKRSAQNLRTTLYYLNKVLEPERAPGQPAFFIHSSGEWLGLRRTERLSVDSWQFEELVREANRAQLEGNTTWAKDRLLEAVKLWRGDYLEDAHGENWAEAERARLRARFVGAATAAGEALLETGHADQCVVLGTRALEVEPWSELAYRMTIRAHIQMGDRASAIRAVQRCSGMLKDLGASPEPATLEMQQQVLRMSSESLTDG